MTARQRHLTAPPGSNKQGRQNPDSALSEQQRNFVRNIVEFKLNATAAARQAGYSHPKTQGSALLKNPKIAAAIAVEREEFAKASGMTKKKVIDGLAESIDMARMKGDPTTMVMGWREIGKMCGFYEPTKAEIKISVTGKVMVEKLQAMSDEELLALAEQDIDAIDGEFHVVD